VSPGEEVLLGQLDVGITVLQVGVLAGREDVNGGCVGRERVTRVGIGVEVDEAVRRRLMGVLSEARRGAGSGEGRGGRVVGLATRSWESRGRKDRV
jgi:hypothetical protein